MHKCFLLLLTICTLQACSQNNTVEKKDLEHYAVSTPVTIILPKTLREISGIVFSAESDSSLFAEQDEAGNIYTVNIRTGATDLFNTIQQNGDFEDIAYNGKNIFYLLRSDGTIFSIPKQNNLVPQDIKQYKLLPNAEYEGLCYRSEDNSLYALAKTIPGNKKGIFIYQLPLNTNNEPHFGKKTTIQTHTIENTIDNKIGHFKPSAITYNSMDRQWFILSSINLSLLVLDDKWQILDYAQLNRSQYPQPEGMAFDNKGNLWISSEAGTGKHGKIYKIARREKALK